ncbi:MAG: right-handed parallel beta-helix repeat-containing protein, partial [Planctomycetota bacterium]
MSVRASLSACLAVVVCILSIPCATTAKTIYVDDDAAGANDGTSWADAYTYLQDALMFAGSGDEIRVAQGVYRPDDFVLSDRANMGRGESFQLINGVTLKGGYAGVGEPDGDGRDVELYETILSGDLNGNDVDGNDAWGLLEEPSRSENSYHVVTGSKVDQTAVLDGFIVTGGNADYVYSDVSGAGMYNFQGHPTVTNCTFTKNSAYSGGGGMFNRDASPTVADCTFAQNSAYRGGGMFNFDGGGARLVDCTFTQNVVYPMPDYECDDLGHGGGVSNWDCNSTVINCTFTANSAVGLGGGMENDQASPTLIKCTFSGNIAFYSCNGGGAGGGMFNRDCSPIVTNCTFSK